MAALKLLNLLALASVAIVALSSLPAPANALVADRAQVARQAHDAVAKRKRSDASTSSGRCKPKPSSSLADSPLTPAPPTSTPVPILTTPVPVTSATSSAAPSPTSSSTSTGSKKWGLAWGMGDDPSALAKFALSNVGYLYTWSPEIPSGLSDYGIAGMSMLWGYNQVTDFQSVAVGGYAGFVLGPNEPNEPSQSNMSPQDGATLWQTYINPLQYEGYKLISPACTNDDAGLTWYQEFFAACTGCHFDGIAFHAYTTSAQSAIDYANTLYNTYGLDIWITEFADQDFSGANNQATMDEVWDFAGQMATFVNDTPWVAAAFPFGVMTDLQGVNTDNALLGSDGNPTSLAYFYFG